ncbi:CBS domain-containing protein [Taklimakanibacter deserti]|uniref:CBS domain-containing protein n=1 Tax=Taklimakanibacter deserti TaxID=2267839 RepID=UPI000E647527
MRIEQLIPLTSDRLRVIDMDATLQAAAHLLSHPGIGLVIVCGGNGKAAGVLSKSDLVRHLAHRDPARSSVAALMSRDIVACTPEDEVYAVWQTMAERRLQNMPILGRDSIPIGILDIRDAMKALFEQERYQERMLSDYVAGLGYH